MDVINYTPGQYFRMAEARKGKCKDIAAEAQRRGLNATWQQVNRRYPVWIRWYEGRLSTGYLMRQTGVRLRQYKTTTQ